MPIVLLAAALLLAAAPRVHAGCKRRRAPGITDADRFFNHQPLLQLPLEALPKEWNWNDVGGRSYLVPSWNQHIPK
jgi:hypothetical protein